MSDDIITTAVEEAKHNNEREASANVDGVNVRLLKEQYQKTQRGGYAWRIAVYVGEEQYPSERVGSLTAKEAEQKFDELKEAHDLIEDKS